MDINEKNLLKLQKLFSLMDSDTLTKEDFVKAFENVVKKVLEIEKRNMTAVDTLEKTYANLLEKISNDHTSSLSDLKRLVGELVNLHTRKIANDFEAKMISVDEKMAEIKNGKDADEIIIVGKVKEQIKIPTIEEIENDLPKLGLPIRDSLELLQGDERLDKSAIKGLDEELKKITIGNMMGQGAGGGARGRIHYYDLTPQCNGVLKTFKIPSNFGVFGVWSTQAPMNYRPMIDWTTGDKTLTLTSEVGAPQTGQTLWIGYTK